MPEPTIITVNQAVAAELRVAAARQRATQRDVARRLNFDQPDAAPMWVHRRMSGGVEISVEDLVLLAEALNVSPVDVLSAALSALPADPVSVT